MAMLLSCDAIIALPNTCGVQSPLTALPRTGIVGFERIQTMTDSIPLGRGKGMTEAERDEFLQTSRAFIKVATIGEDGWPMVNPVWYTYEDGLFYIITKPNASFCRNLRRDPRTTLLIDNPEVPYKRVLVRGEAEFVSDVDWHERGREMVLRYLGEVGFGYYDATSEFPRETIRIRPISMSTWNGGGVDRTFFEMAKWQPTGESPA
jgi:PPOX class probable F420-dependent enzyme